MPHFLDSVCHKRASGEIHGDEFVGKETAVEFIYPWTDHHTKALHHPIPEALKRKSLPSLLGGTQQAEPPVQDQRSSWDAMWGRF